MSTDLKPKQPLGGKTQLSAKSDRLHRLIYLALLLALAIVLSWFEGMLPPIPAPVPLKFGLSNIAVMYALFFLGGKEVFVLAILKSLFVLIMRGPLPAALSLAGGLLSVLVMYLLNRLFKEKGSYFMLSIAGAITHNLGQFLVLLVFFNALSLLWILPILLITGIGTGIVSASLLRLLIPALKRMPGISKEFDFLD